MSCGHNHQVAPGASGSAPMSFVVQELRPEVLAIALLMEERLREKDEDKGQNWKEADIDHLRVCAVVKCYQTEQHIHKGDNLAAARSAVDLANYAMMIADVAGALEIENGGAGWAGSAHMQTYDLIEHLKAQQDFSLRTFGPGMRTKGLIDHITKELGEIEANPGDVTEWIDVVLLGLDGAWRIGIDAEDICKALQGKLKRNMARQWHDWRTVDTTKAIEHVKDNG